MLHLPSPGPFGRGILILAVASVVLAADRGPRAVPRFSASDNKIAEALDMLRKFENRRREDKDFATLPPSNRALGPNPYRIAPLSDSRFVTTLRGEDRVAVLDGSFDEVQSFAAPASPTGLCVTESSVYATGEESGSVYVYPRLTGGTLGEPDSIRIEGAQSLRDVTAGDSLLYVLENLPDRLVTVSLRDGSAISRTLLPRGTVRLARFGDFLVVNALLEHAILIFPLDARGLPDTARAARIEHDGPMWCFDAEITGNGLLLAAGGVEDHPLDRTGGFFGYVDSFVFLYRARRSPGGSMQVEQVNAVNVSEAGVVTPKWIDLETAGDDTALVVTGYGGFAMARLAFPGGLAESPEINTWDAPPGIHEACPLGDGSWIASDPLFDTWVLAGPESPCRMGKHSERREKASRMGEALFFTTLMAPQGTSEGPKSRFTCETCHFEGHVDGRIHYTGRGAVHAATKPLYGLFNNKPHFSRALDEDMTEMVHNEFRVAGAESPLDPWFTLDPAGFPGLAETVDKQRIEPADLRRFLMTFLMEFTHPTNPLVVGVSSWSPLERRGAEAFRDRCEGCHAARLVADDPASRAPFEDWMPLVLSREGPIVWGSSGYRKTGVLPYVHDDGARTPSLRRIARKFPYFTNGSVRDLRTLLEDARFGGESFHHAGVPEGLERLDSETVEALIAFLALL